MEHFLGPEYLVTIEIPVPMSYMRETLCILQALDFSAETKNRKANGEGGEQQQSAQTLPPDLAKSHPQDVVDIEALKKKSRPPKRFTEATLLNFEPTSVLNALHCWATDIKALATL